MISSTKTNPKPDELSGMIKNSTKKTHSGFPLHTSQPRVPEKARLVHFYRGIQNVVLDTGDMD